MKNFIFSDFFINQTKIRKQWLLLFSALVLLLGLSQSSYAQQPCEITVTISSESYGDQTTWQLLDGFGQPVLSGGFYSYDYTDTKTYMATNPPYSLKIMIADYCYNAPSYLVTVGGEQDISGTVTDCGPINVIIPLQADLTPCFPPCPAPQLMIDGVSYTSADLYWISEGTLFDLEWGESGFTPGQGTLLTGINGTSHTLNNLDSETYYQYYVRRNCGTDGYSIWSGPYNFYTGYCSAFSTYDGFLGFSDFSTSEAYINIINQNNGIDTSYNDFTNYSVTHSAGGSFNYQLSVSYASSVYIWVDWNNNMIFEGNELVAEHEYEWEDVTFTGTINIPENISTGNYRMRVRSRYALEDLIANPCGETFAGETEDYTISVIPIPICLPPSGTVASYIGVEFVNIEWISTGNAFQIEYGLPGFSLGQGIDTVSVTGASGIISGLTGNTAYQYYVRQDCNSDGYSFWAGPYNFTTAIPGQVGGGTATTGNFPIQSCANYNYSQQIYLKNEVEAILDTGATFITAIRFKSLSVSAPQNSEKWTVYLGNTTQSEFISSSDWIPNADLEQVFSGQLSFVSEDWVEISLDTPFIWDGVSNLVVGIYEETLANSCVGNWAAFNSGSDRGIIYYGESTPNLYSPPTANYGPNSVIAQMQIEAVELPLCVPPTGLGAEIAFPSANLSWIANGSSFEVEWGESSFTLGQGNTVTGISGVSYTLSELDSDTSYEYYVLTNCGVGEYSTWSGPYTFFTGYCSPSITYNSNTGNRITGFSTSLAYINIYNFNNGTANEYNDFTAYAVTYSAGESFNYSVDVPTGTRVEVWIDYNNNMVFESNELVAASAELLWGTTLTGTIAIPNNLPNGNYRMRVRSHHSSAIVSPCGEIYNGETEDYTLSIISVPSCLFPSGLTVTGVSYTSADLSWTSQGTSFNVEYGTLGFMPGGGTLVSDEISGNSYTLTGLTPETDYQYYVQTNCGTDGTSFWAGPYSFYTGYCLASADESVSGIRIKGFSTLGGYTNIFNPNNGFNNNNTYYNFANQSVTQSVGENFTYEISVGENTTVDIWIDWNNNFLFEENELVANHDDDVIYQYVPEGAVFTGTINIPVGQADGNYRMRVRSRFYYNTTANPCGYLNLGETEDYTVTIMPVPTCTPPHTFLENVISLTSAELYWESDGDSFEVEYGPQGFTVGNGTPVTGITATSVTLSNLAPDTYYDYYVRRNCGTDGYSLWSEPHTFFTSYCEAFSIAAGEYITSFVTTGGFSENITSNNMEGSPNGYGLHTDMLVNHYVTGSVSFSVTTTQWANMGLNIWVDWNNNLEFEENEMVYDSGTTNTSFIGSIIAPFGTPPGDYRMRLRVNHNNSGVNTYFPPCGTINNGETQDYTFRVVPSPACLPPFIPTSDNISATSTLLGWQAYGNLYDIEYGITGFTQGTGTIISEVGNPYILGGLTAGVTYDYYVRQNCGTDGVSDWTEPVTFTPGIYQGNIPTMFNDDPQVEDVACATSFSIEVPAGQQIASLNVYYIITSSAPYFTSQQRSVLYSSTLGMGEPQVITGGNIDYPGMVVYDRAVNFANGATGTVEFELKAWRTEGGTGCGIDRVYVENGTWILNATFEDIPTCPNPPADLGYTNITVDSVDLIWTSDETGTFQVKWGTVGFNIETAGTIVSDIEAFSHTLSGLDPSIQYDFYVRRDCSAEDEDDFGDWVGPVRFNSGHCIPYATQGSYFTLFNTTNATENVMYSFPSGSPLGTGYVNTGMIITEDTGETFNFTSNYVGGASGLKIWVDWNNDFIFADDEQVYYVASGSGNKSGEITIPAGTPGGDYRMRVRVQQGGTSNPPACGLIGAGEALDFTLKVSCEEVATPTGDETQPFDEGDTLADLDVTGDNLVWYADEDLTIVLDPTTELVHNTTYYVVSINGSCQSEYLAVTVEQTSSVSDFNSFGFRYYPNPVSEQLYLSANAPISDVTVINMLGQKINVSVNSDNTSVDMSELPTGNYLIKVTIEGVSKTFKVVKN